MFFSTIKIQLPTECLPYGFSVTILYRVKLVHLKTYIVTQWNSFRYLRRKKKLKYAESSWSKGVPVPYCPGQLFFVD